MPKQLLKFNNLTAFERGYFGSSKSKDSFYRVADKPNWKRFRFVD